MASLRLRALVLTVPAGLLLAAGPVAATIGAPSPVTAASASADQAKRQLQQAQANAAAEDTALGRARAQLQQAQARLDEIQQRATALDQKISDNSRRMITLQAQAEQDRAALAAFVRRSYQGGMNTSLTYVLAADNFSAAIQREIAATTVTEAGQQLVVRVREEQTGAQRAHDDLSRQHEEMLVVQEQTVTATALLSVEQDRLTVASFEAHVAVNQSSAQYNAEQSALIANRRPGMVFGPVAGVNFTIDTDLTAPSGETADQLNTFLQGTALQGLGGAYMAAEQQHHVSARYLLAHSIEESAFGTSAIARAKHNIFGYGANDRNPFTNAVTFPSFAACIDFVAGKVAANYLSPGGRFFHGPTLRGMNVSYATDPRWALNIAKIANSFR
jgi:beta-N-acetylglucosaminidase